MIPSYVTGRPTGKETGDYLALDLGGTNLRVCLVTLKGNGSHEIEQAKFKVEDSLKTGDMVDLCDFIASSVDAFLQERPHLTGKHLELAYTFSFPILQTAINRGTLKQWTKGFSCKNAVEKDVAILLQEALSRRGLPVHIAAIVNDTVGTLLAHAYRHPETAMGVIMGTGSNACYYEKIDKIQKWTRPENIEDDEMVVNMEWGAFDNERRVLPMTQYDNKLNRESRNVHQQLYEKMVAGMYLGEIARNAMISLIDHMLLFSGESSPSMNTQWAFETAYLTQIECDTSKDLSRTRDILENTMGIPLTTLADRQIVKHVCGFVGRRAARLVACGLSGVLSHCGQIGQPTVVAIDGSLFEKYSHFEAYTREAMEEMFGQASVEKIRFDHAKDGSGLGAAIIAMIADQHHLSA
ncbi:hexokinase-domain-containing protein [Dichotomocladium elegans]|nr:hexokinase-domain-containing protein [Dichotomocladium elegans]